MPDSHGKKLSLGGKSPKISSKNIPQRLAPAKLRLEIESPPIVLYGQPSNSTGAIFSGQLKLDIKDEKLDIERFTMRLVIDKRMKKPFHAHCNDCAYQETELKTWEFTKSPLSLSKGMLSVKLPMPNSTNTISGEHDFPFSYLFKGHLPATTHGALSSIDYVLKATITPRDSAAESITLTKELSVKRAILPSDLPRQSIRIFPPTNLTAHVELPSVIHPIGQFNCSLRIDGAVKRNSDTGLQTHWKLKRLMWRLEETQKVISPGCPKHAAKAGANPTEKKGIAHQDVRCLNTEELKTGWKGDYSSADGSIECEFPYSIRADSNPICDVKAEDGTEVSHSLVVELIVAEEIAPIKKPNSVTPTGAARVLRMHFNSIVTERSGLGISWDEEQPPVYEDVPAGPPNYPKTEATVIPSSPPGYGTAEEYTGPPIPDYQELDRLHERPSVDGFGEGSSTGMTRPNAREFLDLLQDETDIPTPVEERAPSPDIQ